MAITRTFNGATILDPGAYSKIIVQNLNGFPLLPTGTVGIIGEAAGGQPGVLDILTSTQIQSAKARYKSGPIADALDLLVNPSKDVRIPNGASTIVVYKTNPSTQSQANAVNTASSPVGILAMKSDNYGSAENQDSFSVAQGRVIGQNATLDGAIAGPYTVANTDTLILIVNGTSYTYTCSLTGSQTAAQMVVDLNNAGNWAPSKPVIASVDLVTGFIDVAVDSVAIPAAFRDYGWIQVDPASTLDTILGIVGSARGFHGSRVVSFKQGLINEQMLDTGGVDQFSILYTGSGTAAVLSIQDSGGINSTKTLTTTCTGAAGDNLSIIIQDVNGNPTLTLQQLVDFINSTGKYTAVVLGPNPAMNTNRLDYYLNLPIKTVAGAIRADVQAIADNINAVSQLVNATKISNVIGTLGVTSSPVFLSGAVDGVSSNSIFANGFTAFQEERINVVVPLISADQGSLSIDSINALAASHAIWGWSTVGRSERSCFVSKLTNKAGLIAAAQTLQSAYTLMFGQSVTVLDSTGTLADKDPWAFACIAAGMRAGAEVGEPLTGKIINVNNLFVADKSWNPRVDYNDMINAGVTIGKPLDGGGFKIDLGNTTYGVDANFVWNRESVVQAAGYVAYDLRYNLDLTFTGTKAKTGSAEAIANFIKARMSQYLAADIIVGDDDNKQLGYKNLNVDIQGDTAIINVCVTPVQGIDFILPTIYLADIQQSA